VRVRDALVRGGARACAWSHCALSP
jgi:hypothetical protein